MAEVQDLGVGDPALQGVRHHRRRDGSGEDVHHAEDAARDHVRDGLAAGEGIAQVREGEGQGAQRGREQRDERQGQCRERDELDGDEDRHHRLRRWRVGVEEPSGDGGDQRRHQQRQRRRDGVPGLPGRQMAGESIGGVHDLISTSESTAPPDNGTWPSSRAPGVSPPPSPACARRPCPTRRRARRAGRRPCRARKCGPRATSPGSRRSTPRTPRSGRPRTPRRGPWSR